MGSTHASILAWEIPRATEDEIVGWHHELNRHEFEQTQGDSEGQRSLVCCSPWGHEESDTTDQLNNNSKILTSIVLIQRINVIG